MPPTAVMIGQPATCRRLARQLDLLDTPPIMLGCILVDAEAADGAADLPVLGALDDLEAVIARRRPDLALVSLPATMPDLVAAIRTRLRRLGVPDRFMPTLEDQIAGIGPRTQIDLDLTQLIGRPARRIDEAAVRAVIAGRRVMVTGAGGSIGSELSRIVSRFGPSHLTLVDRSENALFEIDRQIARRHPHLDRRALLHDIVDAEATLAWFETLRPDVVFHAAAHKHVPMMEDHPGAAVDNNLFGTRSVADAADATGVDRFVMVSTDKAVHPSSIMGATKRLAELYIQDLNGRSDTCYSMVRFGNVLGSSGSVLETWARQLRDGGPITVTHPGMTRYFMSIPEAAALVIQSAALVDPACRSAEVFVLDMGEPLRIVDLAERFIRMHGLESVIGDGGSSPDVPSGVVRVVFTGARPGEKLHEKLAFDAECMQRTRHPDINIWVLSRPDHRYIEEIVQALEPSRRSRDATEVAVTIRHLLPEMVEPVAA
ncbi:MAG: polysaccharide biosynthesis protein [Phycisphaerales bacterium]|nr:polysaccharide biosynthesis protein [Phycisphaerales bacterium]